MQLCEMEEERGGKAGQKLDGRWKVGGGERKQTRGREEIMRP